MRRHPRVRLCNTYGPTEATVVACGAKLDGHSPVSIGLPLPGWDLVVVDRSGEPVPVGEVGELVIGGVGLARYLDPEKDAEKYAPLPSLGWSRAYRSGDLVRLEEDGLYFQGRADDQVKVGGRRIELEVTERALVSGAQANVDTLRRIGYDADEAKIEALLAGDIALAASEHIGRARRVEDARGRYIHAVKSSFPADLRLDGLRIVLDCANGAACCRSARHCMMRPARSTG